MKMTAPTTLDLQLDEHVLVVTLNRPEKLNSFDAVMRAELQELWASLAQHPEVRCVVITGNGRAFCTGADVAAMDGERAGEASVEDELRYLPREVQVPIIAAVNGICAGGGLHFLAEADFAIAAESATFLDPHVSVGQVSALEPISLMLRMGEQAMTRMLLLGSRERISAADALRVGLVTEVVADAELRAHAVHLARQIAGNSPSAVARSLRAVRAVRRGPIAEAMQAGWQLVQEQWDHPDALEGPRAFAERRPAQWAER